MTDHPGWYPPGQVCYPPDLPTYLRNVHDLKPIVGVPSDDQVIGIHAVIQAARKASESEYAVILDKYVIQQYRAAVKVPGMHDPGLIMKLNDHLFGVQMGLTRLSQISNPVFTYHVSKCEIFFVLSIINYLIESGQDATYTPPVLPTHLTINLGSVRGAPSDGEIIKVQDAFQTYQEFRRVPSMFDAHVNMELSQHLFDIQMARYMRLAGESPPNSVPQATTSAACPTQNVRLLPNRSDEGTTPTNNAGTGANATEVPQTPHSAPGLDMREMMERSNQLAERFNRLLERSNELVERSTKPADSQSQTFAERFNQVLERLTQLVEQSRQPVEQPDRLAERFNELFERFNQLTEQLNQPAQSADQVVEQLNRSSERSNLLSEQANKSWERLGDVLVNINRVLVGVQHAIVRNHKGNKVSALDCLVNEKGETPAISDVTNTENFVYLSKYHADDPENRLPVVIDGVNQDAHIYDFLLGRFIRFYGIDDGMCEDATSVNLKEGQEGAARERLREYLSSCLG
ncbi:hypothetical protein FRC11_006709 [Ceratobasidium sp. 423]|nr:hypothetical protein FRC11_006709 [Ceratobasidium sp. 423]